MSLRKQTPSDFLKQIIGRPVVVKLNSGVDYRGVLACLDGYMNIALEQTEEYVNGQLKNKYGDAFIRGNNDAAHCSGLSRSFFIIVLSRLRLSACCLLRLVTHKAALPPSTRPSKDRSPWCPCTCNMCSTTRPVLIPLAKRRLCRLRALLSHRCWGLNSGHPACRAHVFLLHQQNLL
ncbi:U6 snRNA-associated Sm-like protein LSm6 isoform X1 [Erinaceus europaeus]|uniref:U6 snRNA-associated Sm-like protein LSm6 isoform X1 n=1 Tax=Erinaceus europaeus TaxID=9365 RepID=A0ABM3WEG9_ERIEU|nr:U6 snRNA-associated Sm-like protein LSm6 isoform X1 [Erinaceus europaeus]XP_060034980.1 U6 snRNA-associated Sm-like protein LSm6 isoform X1 [Erinaceus europaeus]